jgi:heat shock protein HslJ
VRRLLLVLLLVGAGCGSDGDDATIESEATPDSTPELIDTTWVVTGFLDGDHVITIDPPGEEAARLHLEANGFVTGSDGCNGFGYASPSTDAAPTDGLAYVVDGSTITFEGSPVSTLIGCVDNDYEGRARAVLTGRVSYELAGDTLTLRTPDGRGVVYAVET